MASTGQIQATVPFPFLIVFHSATRMTQITVPFPFLIVFHSAIRAKAEFCSYESHIKYS